MEKDVNGDGRAETEKKVSREIHPWRDYNRNDDGKPCYSSGVAKTYENRAERVFLTTQELLPTRVEATA
jgi:hypothetical protein